MDESRFAKLFQKKQVQPGDENVMADNPRNWLADKVNPVLDQYVNPVLPDAAQLAIPKMTVAEDIEFNNNLPENMAGSAMGTLGLTNKAASVARTGDRFNALFKDRPTDFGKVITKPTMADLADDAAKIGTQTKQLKAGDISAQFTERYGQEAAKRMQQVKQGVMSPSAYSEWKQEMINIIRRENG